MARKILINVTHLQEEFKRQNNTNGSLFEAAVIVPQHQKTKRTGDEEWAPILRYFCNGRLRNWKSFAMRSWRKFGIRFFATALVSGNPGNHVWNIWVTAATHLAVSNKYRAEIRLASNKVAECTTIYYNPGTTVFIDIHN